MRRLFVVLVFFSLIFKLNAQVFTDVTSDKGIEDVSEFTLFFGTGASVVDYDNDGDLDIFSGTEFGQKNHLYQNNNGVFSEVSMALGINSTYRNRASLWLDYDGDQLLDLFLLGDCYDVEGCVNMIEIFVFKQNIDHTFTEVNNIGLNINVVSNSDKPIVVGGLSAGDINNDGWVDLLVSVWGAPMSLFLNNNGTFTDISISSNMGVTTESRHQPTFHDFNHDGFQDIYINIDFTENEFWLNNGDNTFQEIAASIGVNYNYNEMGIAVGDYDNDGDFDLYSTNITIIYNGQDKHNTLLRNNWSSTNVLGFNEVARHPNFNVGDSGWDWGTTFFDADNDGFEDLATTNGWAETNEWGINDQSRLWKNVDGLLFQDISNVSGFNDTLDALTLLAFDMDRDGDLDLLQTLKENPGEFKPFKLYENNYTSNTNANNYLVIKPRMNGANHFSIGAVVKISYNNGTTGMRLITAGTSFYGQEPAEAFFGLAQNTIVDEVRVEWPDNTVTVLNNIAVNQVLTVTNDTVLSDDQFNANNIKIFPNPVNNTLNINGNIDVKSVEVYNLLGQKVLSFKSENTIRAIDLSEVSSGNYFVKINNSTSKNNVIHILKQ